MYIDHSFLNSPHWLLMQYTVKKYENRAIKRCIKQGMSHHPWGRTVEILGIQSPRNGRSCEEHPICGCVLQEDSIVRFRKYRC